MKEGEEWDGVLGSGCYTHIFIHRTWPPDLLVEMDLSEQQHVILV